MNQLTTTNLPQKENTKILQIITNRENCPIENVELIVNSISIRHFLNSNSTLEVEGIKRKVAVAVHTLAGMYTSANLDKQNKEDLEHLIRECSNFIIKQFPSISLEEIALAFQLAASHKIEADLRAFNGVFSIAMLGGVLSAYLLYRNRIKAAHQNELTLLSKVVSENEINQKNQDVISEVIANFKNLIVEFEKTGLLDDSKIYPFWGKILVDAKIINFTHEEKFAIFEEALVLAKSELVKTVQNNSVPMFELRSIKEILATTTKDNPHEKIKDLATTIYKRIIVSKAILNNKFTI